MVSNRELSIAGFLGHCDRLYAIGQARQRWQGSGGIVVDDGPQSVCQLPERRGGDVSPCVVESTPESCSRMACGTIGWQQHRHHVGRPADGLGCVPGAMVAHHNLYRLGASGGHAGQLALERTTVALRQGGKAGGPPGRGDGVREKAMLTRMQDGGHRLPPPGGQPTSDDWEEAQAGCMWCKALAWVA